MFPVVTVFVTLVCKFTVGDENHDNKEPAIYSRAEDVHTVFNSYVMPLNKMDHEENMLLVPNFLNGPVERVIKKKKYPKKGPPKWMTQKIIKKSKAKRKKMNYYNQFTSAPEQPATEQQQNQEDLDPIPEDSMPEVQKKNNGKLARYPMPFHKLATWKDKHKRIAREANRSDAFILQDFDAIEFISQEKDKDIIKTHMKSYW